MKLLLITLALIAAGAHAHAQQPATGSATPQQTRVRIATNFGDIVVALYDSTPIHRDNFLKLVDQGFYDSLLFHRVIPSFMIQGGDPSSKRAAAWETLGEGGDVTNRLPPEILPQYFHKKGALAAARDGNPEKKSSTQQFYLVDGRTYSDAEMDAMEAKLHIKISPEHRAVYKTIGGAPFLDDSYTVFGEVVEGQDVVRTIASEPANEQNRPLTDVRMRITRVQK